MNEPCIKGVIVHGLVEEIRRSFESGALAAEELEARLEKEELALLHGKLNPAVWVPIRLFARLSEVVLELQGGSFEESCLRSGERSARRMIDAGVYHQLDSLERLAKATNEVSAEERFQALGRMLRLTMSLSKGIYNFGDWKVRADPDHPRRYRVEVTDAEPLPQSAVIGTVGFLNECSRAASSEVSFEWSVERPRADLVIYRMTPSSPRS